MQGKVVSLLIQDKSIDGPAFQEFLKITARKTKRSKCYMLVDNLGVHRTKDVTE